jgi:FKBP12-rapamycin complex-associated protein
MQAVNQLGDANEVLNERAVAVMARMSHKLTGKDFSSGSTSGAGISPQHGSEHWASGDARDAEPGLSVKVQVQKLILQATSHENLCQNYVGYVLIILPYPISRNFFILIVRCMLLLCFPGGALSGELLCKQ